MKSYNLFNRSMARWCISLRRALARWCISLSAVNCINPRSRETEIRSRIVMLGTVKSHVLRMGHASWVRIVALIGLAVRIRIVASHPFNIKVTLLCVNCSFEVVKAHESQVQHENNPQYKDFPFEVTEITNSHHKRDDQHLRPGSVTSPVEILSVCASVVTDVKRDGSSHVVGKNRHDGGERKSTILCGEERQPPNTLDE